jgi:hypothetical protein
LRQQPLIAPPAGAPAAVKGGGSRRAARARLTTSWRAGYQRNIRTRNLTISPADLTVCQTKFQLLQINILG